MLSVRAAAVSEHPEAHARSPARKAAAPATHLPDATLLDRSVFIDAPVDVAGRVWAVEQAIRCKGFGVVIADAHGFPMSATRRLHLAVLARTTPQLILLARPPNDRSQISSALTRWDVSLDVPYRSGRSASLPMAAPSRLLWWPPVWCVRLIRCRSSLIGALGSSARGAITAQVWSGANAGPSVGFSVDARGEARVDAGAGAISVAASASTADVDSGVGIETAAHSSIDGVHARAGPQWEFMANPAAELEPSFDTGDPSDNH